MAPREKYQACVYCNDTSCKGSCIERDRFKKIEADYERAFRRAARSFYLRPTKTEKGGYARVAESREIRTR